MNKKVFAVYNSQEGRWTTRDPIEERCDEHLYLFCGNCVIHKYDVLGQAHFEVRKLNGTSGIISYMWTCPLIGFWNALALDLHYADKWNIEILHEHLFYDDGTNVGYGPSGTFNESSTEGYHQKDFRQYDDCIMKEAEKLVKPLPYSLLGIGKPKFNCQDYADALREKYEEIKDNPEIKCKCKE